MKMTTKLGGAAAAAVAVSPAAVSPAAVASGFGTVSSAPPDWAETAATTPSRSERTIVNARKRDPKRDPIRDNELEPIAKELVAKEPVATDARGSLSSQPRNESILCQIVGFIAAGNGGEMRDERQGTSDKAQATRNEGSIAKDEGCAARREVGRRNDRVLNNETSSYRPNGLLSSLEVAGFGGGAAGVARRRSR